MALAFELLSAYFARWSATAPNRVAWWTPAVRGRVVVARFSVSWLAPRQDPQRAEPQEEHQANQALEIAGRLQWPDVNGFETHVLGEPEDDLLRLRVVSGDEDRGGDPLHLERSGPGRGHDSNP